MEIPNIQGLDKIYQAISEASEIEKCSICLERLESTVLLWPCTHWFCNNCILTLHKRSKGEKVACPLCKCATTRRKILHFQDKQTEYEDHLQTLIGALSLDLKFDVTSYNNIRNHGNPLKIEKLEPSKEVFNLSPVKRTRAKAPVRVVEVNKKPNNHKEKKPRIRSGNVIKEKINSTVVEKGKAHNFKSPKPIPASLPETPDSPRQKKVKEWLDSTKFSEADQDVCVETVVADVHNAECDESLNFSETALLSVSQADHGCLQTPIKPIPVKKPVDTPSDIDAIKAFNKCSSKGILRKSLKNITVPAVEKFDQLFPENKKLQTVTTTYGSKNPYTSTRTRAQRFTVQEDLFKSIDENKTVSEKSGSGEPSEKSETLEDFSSGSGEEWRVEKRPRKCNLLGKGLTKKNKMKENIEGKNKKSIEKFVSSKTRRNSRNLIKQDFKEDNNKNNNVQNPNHKKDTYSTKVKCVAVEEFSKPKEGAVKEIIDDWNDTKDTNNMFPDKSLSSAKQDGDIRENSERLSKNLTAEFNRHKNSAKTVDTVLITPHNEVKTRSPGWSRLKSTKKDFHLSEKKKLSLKTQKSNSSLTNIGISPLVNQSKSSVSDSSNLERSAVQSHNIISVDEVINSPENKINDKNVVNVGDPCDTKNKKTPELSKSLNISLTSSVSPFTGFPTPEERESSKRFAKVTPSNAVKPLLNQSKSSVSGNSNLERVTVQSHNIISVDEIVNSPVNKISDKNVVNDDLPCDSKNKKTPELRKSLNTSLTSSTSGSPFRGFLTPEVKESSKTIVKVTPNDTSSLPHKPSEQSNKDLNKKIPALYSYGLSKEDPMDIDILPVEGTKPLFSFENNEKHNVATKLDKGNCKSLKGSSFLEASDITPVFQEELNRSSIITKKRDRDSGIHNESGVSSPVRKKVCRDAEVQTSPGRMKSAIREMLKDMCGVELDEIIKQSTKIDVTKKPDSIDIARPDHNFPGLSQDSDKENVDISSKNRNVSKKCSDDSDIVFGTEDSVNGAQIQHCAAIAENLFYNDVDPDAPTQRYKTPIVPKKPLQTSTKEYTVVSNPTSSELKTTDFLFDKSDLIFPDETPKGITPWNYSGVDKLEGNTDTVKKSVNKSATPNSSLSLKEKHRSRRQLDFVEENYNDVFEFERQISDKLGEVALNNESNNFVQSDQVGTIHDPVDDELEDIFMQSNELIDTSLNSPEKNKADSDSHENILTDQQEKNMKDKLESENLSDTSGIVGPSEVQCYGRGMNLCSPDKPNGKCDLDKNVAGDKPSLCSPNTSVEICKSVSQNTHVGQSTKNRHAEDPSKSCLEYTLMINETSTEQKAASSKCVNARDDDEESNPSSDVSFVEGTPDVSQNEINHKEVSNVENDIRRTSDPLLMNVHTSKVQDDREKTESLANLVHKSVCASLPERLKPKDTEKSIAASSEERVKQKDSEKTIANDESVMLENSEVTQEYLCFASSLLNQQQTQVLVCVLAGMGLVYSKTVGPHISHLIVGTKNGCFQNTYKVLLAMALHKPIIRFDWVEEVIRTGGTVPLDPFVALDPSGECGVLRAKADKHRTLLQDFAIHIYNVNDRIVLKEQIEELVRLCGGIVVKELQEFHNIPRDKFRVIVLSEPSDSLTQGDWRQKYSAVEVMIDWVYNTIGRYRVMPLVPFMVTEAVDAISFLQHQGYPKELIFDLSTQD